MVPHVAARKAHQRLASPSDIVYRIPISKYPGSDQTSVSLNSSTDISAVQKSPAGSPLEVLRIFLKLGLTCFGGPIAHIGYFREEFVVRRKWIDEHAYADLVGLCQFLPGPASSQVGFSIGLMRAGYLGALAAWTGFTLPSAAILILFAYGAAR